MVRIAISFLINLPSGEKSYMVDSDFYTSKRVTPQDLIKKLEFLHDNSTQLIHLIIKEKLHNAMEPKEL